MARIRKTRDEARRVELVELVVATFAHSDRLRLNAAPLTADERGAMRTTFEGLLAVALEEHEWRLRAQRRLRALRH